MGSESVEVLLRSDNEAQDNGICIRVLKQQPKSLEILKSVLKSFISNTKLMFFLILSTLPLFFIMVIYESNIHKLVDLISEMLVEPSHTYYYNFDINNFVFYDETEHKRIPVRNFLQVFPFYLVLSPLMELWSLTVITNIAKTYLVEEKEATFKETLYEVFYLKYKIKGPLFTAVLVQLLSTSTIIGLFWTLANYFIVTSGIDFYDIYLPKGSYIIPFLAVFHVVIFMGLLYKFLDWSAMWNMGIIVSVLEDETGTDALQVSSYCCKQSRQTGFQLMLFFFVFGGVLRLPILLGVNVAVTILVIFLLCLVDVMKWVALLLNYCECKAQIFLKKVDEEMGNEVKNGDV